jgi:glycerate-2-kinase
MIAFNFSMISLTFCIELVALAVSEISGDKSTTTSSGTVVDTDGVVDAVDVVDAGDVFNVDGIVVTVIRRRRETFRGVFLVAETVFPLT